MTFFHHLHSHRCLFSSSYVPLRLRKILSCSKYRFIHDGNPQKPYYITTPIFYPNASPHIGHLYSLVTGDVFARYQRLKGRDVRFLAGTDEHGLKIQKAARVHFGEAGKEREFCDALSDRFRDLAQRANISNTCFMRTSSKEHHLAVEDVWSKLSSKGYIYKSQYSGWYSVTDECFYTDSQVDDGYSLETGSAVEWSSEENYMFRLSAFRGALLEHYTSHPDAVYPPQYHENMLAMLGVAPVHPTHTSPQGPAEASSDFLVPPNEVTLVNDLVLADISISRPRSRLEWGVQVPEDPEQTIYVWFDALLVYLTGAGYPWLSPTSTSPSSTSTSPLHPTLPSKSPSSSSSTSTSTSMPASASASASTWSPAPRTNPPESSSGWEQGWPADIQVIGKDILRFHAIYFPAILLALSGAGAGESCPPPPRDNSFRQHVHASQAQMLLEPQIEPQIQIQTQRQIQSQPQAHRPIPLAKTLLTHAHWTSAQKKMSKSLGNVADPIEAMEKWGADVVRFYLMRVGGRWRSDVDWSSEQLDKHHKEIQAQLGNYFLRIASPRIAERARALSAAGVNPAVPEYFRALVADALSSYVPTSDSAAAMSDGPPRMVDLNSELLRLTFALPATFEDCMDRLEAGQALAEVMGVLKFANKTLTDIAPWSTSTNPAIIQTTRVVALETLRVVGVCLVPFMPNVAEKLLDGLQLNEAERGLGIFPKYMDDRDGEGDVQAEIKKIWERWVRREVKGVKLF